MTELQRIETRKRIRRAKEAERSAGRWLLENDGEDPLWKNIASSTGRVGHITGLQFDNISATYAGEVKNVRVPAKLWGWWRQIVEIAARHHKEPILIIEPTNIVPEHALFKKIPKLHIITEQRHAELLAAEKKMNSADEPQVNEE